MTNIYIVDYYDFNKQNGLSTYVDQLHKGLAKQDGITLNFILVNSTAYKVFEKETIKNITYYHLPNHIGVPNDRTEFDAKAATYLAAEMTGKENIVVHFNWINHSPFAYQLKPRVNCITVLTKHCIPWRDQITSNYPLFIRLNKLYAGKGQPLSLSSPVLAREKWCYQAMDHIICVTESGKQSLQKMFRYPVNRISVIYNGIVASDLQTGKRTKNVLRKKYGFTTNEKLILFAGVISDKKGAFDLAKAFDELLTRYPNKNWRLVFAGSGDHSKLLEGVKINWSKIIFTGKLSKEQLYEFYSMADIGIVPSYIEQCSYTVIEMMSMGLPIIVSGVDGLKEIVPDDCGLKVKIRLGNMSAAIDTKDLCNKILFYIENENLAKKYAQRASAYALQQFSTGRMTAETIAVYKKLVAGESLNLDIPVTAKSQSLVSIVMPVHNGEEYIGECINSILRQNWQNFELIVIDDGSTDNTISVIENFSDQRIRYVKNERNKGIVYSLNKGISLARGKYIARIDADDKMHVNRLCKQVQYLENHTDVALVGSWHFIIDPKSKVIGIKEYPVDDEEIRSLSLFVNPFSHPSVMMRTEVARAFNYTNEFNYCEDYELWMKIIDQYKTANIPECLTYYRVHSLKERQEYIKEQGQSTIELLSAVMDELGIEHSVEELTLHAAIVLRTVRKNVTSNSPEALIAWVNKVLEYQQKIYNYPSSLVKKVKDYVTYDYCGLSQ